MVRNRARSEGSIAEAYIVKEYLSFRENWKVVQSSQHRYMLDPSLLQSNVVEKNDENDAYQQDNLCMFTIHNDEAPLEVEISENIISPSTNNYNEGEGEECDEGDDTWVEYFSSDDEEPSQAYVDSDLEY
ncbi:hypothetical protein ACJIZ3_019911 [Penstemon smallii]|uniref:Uncharacterized protein n=1 Tax=Penstemon smallii TaxID=265156 RepID=A0ABD3T2I4_9LAMI